MAWLSTFLVELLTAVLAEWTTGKLSAPVIVHDSIATPAADKIAGDAMVADFLPK